MTSAAKLAIGVLSLSSIGGLGYFGNIYLNNGKSVSFISELIKEEFKYVLLDTEEDKDSSFWGKNWEIYNKENENNESGKDSFKLTGWTKNNTQNLTSELKKECEKASQKTVTNNADSIYLNVTKYCTRGVTVKEDAEKKEKQILKTDGSNADVWKKRESNKQNLKEDLKKLDVTGNDNQLTADAIKNGCSKSITKNKKDEQKYPEIYQAYERICTKQEGDSE